MLFLLLIQKFHGYHGDSYLYTGLMSEKRTFFLSDSHLGAPDAAHSRAREQLLVQWFDEYGAGAKEIYLLGDIFDFWFEYHTVVPKGFVRLLGKIASVIDSGTPVHYFTGNHDMWAFDYFEKELGVIMHRKPLEKSIGGRSFLIGHGDGLGPGDTGYKMLKAVFACRVCQKMFSFMHPYIGIRMAMFFSRKSRLANENNPEMFKGEDQESLVHYCKNQLKTRNIDYFVFGHRHLPLKIEVMPGIYYINTGEWLSQFSFASFDGETMSLHYYKPQASTLERRNADGEDGSLTGF